MLVSFYICAAVAVISTLMAITRLNPIHSLLYFIVSLLSVGVIFFIFGTSFAAALIVIINAGAIMVLFVFVVMMLNLGPQTVQQEKEIFTFRIWILPCILVILLAAGFIYQLSHYDIAKMPFTAIGPKRVAVSLMTTYLVGVELASMLLLAGMLGAYHLGRSETVEIKEQKEE